MAVLGPQGAARQVVQQAAPQVSSGPKDSPKQINAKIIANGDSSKHNSDDTVDDKWACAFTCRENAKTVEPKALNF